jgi:hypothetical protein
MVQHPRPPAPTFIAIFLAAFFLAAAFAAFFAMTLPYVDVFANVSAAPFAGSAHTRPSAILHQIAA